MKIANSWGTEVDNRAKTHFLQPSGIRLNFCIVIDKIVLDMNPLYSNATSIATRGKMHFV